MRKLVKPLARVYHKLFRAKPIYHTLTYSQEGEDLILKRVFADRSKGFFVDVGAHHPKRLSNTYLFYALGWSGINIDAMPGSMTAFARERPRDINLECAVSQVSGQLMTYFIFNEPAVNTFDEALAKSRVGGPHDWKIIRTIEVRTRTLREIFASHLPPATAIDFMTVDVEGFDLEVLRSNDWTAYRPAVVLAELFGVSAVDQAEDEVFAFLVEQGYEFIARTVNTVFFRDASLPKLSML